MPISFVGASPVVTGANPTVDVPAGVVAGDLLIVNTSSSNFLTPPTGWTFISSSSTAFNIIVKIATSSETSLPLSINTAGTTAVMLAYRGVGYVDVVGTIPSGTSTSASTASVTTRFANDWILSFYTNGSGVTNTWTIPASTTQRVNQGSTTTGIRSLLIVDENQAVAGASAIRTATLSTSSNWAATAIALKEPQDFYIDPINGNDANNGRTFATSLKNISGATAAKGITAGDTVRVEETPTINTGVNATWTSVQQRGISPFGGQSITNATNATPIVCTTSLAHGYSTGDVVQIQTVNGNTAANGVFKLTVVNSTSFSLDDSSGNGAYTSGGTIQPIFCRTIKTATPLVQPIASFAPLRTASLGTRLAWVGATANVTTSFPTNGALGKGGSPDLITIAAGFTTGKIAYYTLPSALNLSSYQQLSLFINQLSGTLGGLTISLCSDLTGDVPIDTFTIPSTGTLNAYTPFTFNKGSALGSSILSISISRAANNGAQQFQLNSIVAVKTPSAVDALSNTSLVTKNNGTEGAYAVGGFGGSDGSIVFLDNSPQTINLNTTGGAYYGTTETASLWRIEPYNPYTLNSLALPTTSTDANARCLFPTANGGILNNPITFSGGWNTTDMSTRTGQTWFSNQNGNGFGISNNADASSYITTDRVNYTRCLYGWYGNASFLGNIIQNCNYTATGNAGIQIQASSQQQLQSCIVTNTGSIGMFNSFGSNNINSPTVINNCTFSGNVTANVQINTATNGFPYYTITNNTFNTSSANGLSNTQQMFGTLTNNSFNYFNTTGLLATNNILGTINNLTFVPEPAGGGTIIQAQLTNGNSVLPQNIYTTFNNVTVNAPTTTYSQGSTPFTYALSGCANFKFVNSNFGATNVTYTSGNQLLDQGGAYLYNCTGVPTTITSQTNNVPPFINNAAFYSQDENNTVGNNKIYFSGGLATSQTAVRNTPSGYAWSMAPTSTTTVTSVYPIKLKIASIAANGGSPVTISTYMRRTNTGLTMQLVCPAGQPYGPSTDTVASMTAAANTWEQVSISFTPTQNAVYDIYAYAFGGTTFTGYVDDLEVTQ
jgi:hypothetical protein